MRANYRTLSDAFGGAALPLVDYCVKTNYEHGLLCLLRELGTGAMVSCDWELRLALEAGFPPERITFHGPCKSAQEIDAAVAASVGLIHVYSAAELDLLDGVAAAHGRRVDVSLRLAIPGPWPTRWLSGWYANRLGVPPAEAIPLLRRIASSPSLRLRGLSVHVGTHVTRPAPYLRAIGALIRLAKAAEVAGLPLQEIDLGGGWPSDTLQPLSLGLGFRLVCGRERPPARPLLAPLAQTVAQAFRSAAGRAHLSTPPTVRLEPGRGLVGSAGLLVTRVVARRGRWLFVDASRNLLPESWLVGRRAVRPVARRDEQGRRYHLSGKTMNTADIMALAVSLPTVEVGDVLAFLDAGAYALSRANRYAGTIPAAYLLDDSGEPRQIRKQDTYEDIIAAMVDVGQRPALLA